MFSAVLNAQNKLNSIPIDSVTWSISGPTNSTYSGSAQSVTVVSVSPAGATYSTSTTSATNTGEVASTTITGTGIYTGSFTSFNLTISQRTITATNTNIYEGAFQPDNCAISSSVSGFNITIGGLTGSGKGVPVSVLYGTSFESASLCGVSFDINVEGVVSSRDTSPYLNVSPYQNVVYNTNGVKTINTNFNSPPKYFWCVVNSSSFGGGSYNGNYSTEILSFGGSPAPFYNSCQT